MTCHHIMPYRLSNHFLFLNATKKCFHSNLIIWPQNKQRIDFIQSKTGLVNKNGLRNLLLHAPAYWGFPPSFAPRYLWAKYIQYFQLSGLFLWALNQRQIFHWLDCIRWWFPQRLMQIECCKNSKKVLWCQ